VSKHPLGAIVPLTLTVPPDYADGPNLEPQNVERTGAQAGLSQQAQILIVLETIQSKGGSAEMADLYAAVTAAMTPYRLSPNGKAALRCSVNRTCTKRGLLEADTVARRTALWRITPAGVALVSPPVVLAPVPPPVALVPVPRPKALREPLLAVLGQLTGYAPGVFVDSSLVLDEVIREAGFDPDDLPVGWDRTARLNGAGIDRNIGFAFRYGYHISQPALTMRGSKVGQWGLTSHGVAHLQQLLPHPLPKPRALYEPILQVLGRLSNHTANVAIDQKVIYRAVLVHLGVDPDALPPSWGVLGSNRQVKALDQVRSAVKSMRKGDAWIHQPERCNWCLTEAGEKEARQLNGVAARPAHQPAPAFKRKKPTGPNLTAKWLGSHLTPPKGQAHSNLYQMMRGALAKRLPVSAGAELLDDHIQNFMVRAIRRDSFRRVLSDGGTLPYSKVVAYCVNSGRTDARDMGTEPVCRELYGARTEKERRDYKGAGEMPFGGRSTRYRDTDDNLVPPEQVTSIEDATDFDDLWTEIERTVEDHKPQAWQRYAGILAMKARGCTTKEIADSEGVSRNRAASMLAEARRCVRQDYQDGVFDAFL